jgi:hypothetical protein
MQINAITDSPRMPKLTKKQQATLKSVMKVNPVPKSMRVPRKSVYYVIQSAPFENMARWMEQAPMPVGTSREAAANHLHSVKVGFEKRGIRNYVHRLIQRTDMAVE